MSKMLILVPIIKQISKVKVPGKKALQKLIYLLQRKGFDLGFDYSIHYYGPYSSALDYSVQSLEMQGAIEMDLHGYTWTIHTTSMGEDAAEENGYKDLKESKQDIIKFIIDNFAGMTARQLELITTTDYVANMICKDHSKLDDTMILEGVRRIKDDKFPSKEITDSIQMLKRYGFIN